MLQRSSLCIQLIHCSPLPSGPPAKLWWREHIRSTSVVQVAATRKKKNKVGRTRPETLAASWPSLRRPFPELGRSLEGRDEFQVSLSASIYTYVIEYVCINTEARLQLVSPFRCSKSRTGTLVTLASFSQSTQTLARKSLPGSPSSVNSATWDVP